MQFSKNKNNQKIFIDSILPPSSFLLSIVSKKNVSIL